MKIFKYESYEQYLDCQMDHEKTKDRTAGRPFDKYIEKINLQIVANLNQQINLLDLLLIH